MDLAVLVCPVLVVVEAPFSDFSCGSFLVWISFLCTTWWGSCATIRATRGAVMCSDASNACKAPFMCCVRTLRPSVFPRTEQNVPDRKHHLIPRNGPRVKVQLGLQL